MEVTKRSCIPILHSSGTNLNLRKNKIIMRGYLEVCPLHRLSTERPPLPCSIWWSNSISMMWQVSITARLKYMIGETLLISVDQVDSGKMRDRIAFHRRLTLLWLRVSIKGESRLASKVLVCRVGREIWYPEWQLPPVLCLHIARQRKGKRRKRARMADWA